MRSSQFPSNWELASGRALSVVKTMIEGGMPANRVSAASFGDTAPVAANSTPEEKAQNRRIEIVIVPDLSSLPGYDELQRYSNENVKTAAPAPAEPKKKSATPAAPAAPTAEPKAKKPNAPAAETNQKKSESSSSDVKAPGQ